MAFHGLLLIMSLKSCLIDVFWFTGGEIRSLVVKNVISINTTTTTANNKIVDDQPF